MDGRRHQQVLWDDEALLERLFLSVKTIGRIVLGAGRGARHPEVSDGAGRQ
jgi:hypothetical protein